MAIHAYEELYLPEVQHKLALYFDLMRSLGLDADVAAKYFILSGYAEDFQEANPFVISGMSAEEICRGIFDETDDDLVGKFQYSEQLSPEYWLGYSLAYYQWKTRIEYKDIFAKISASELVEYYNPYHEMDIEHFCDLLDKILGREKIPLKAIRGKKKLSQSDLACLSGVPLRSIQQYEQGRKELSKASFETVYALSKALRVSPIELV